MKIYDSVKWKSYIVRDTKWKLQNITLKNIFNVHPDQTKGGFSCEINLLTVLGPATLDEKFELNFPGRQNE